MLIVANAADHEGVLLFAEDTCIYVGKNPDKGAWRVTHLCSRGEKTHRINQGLVRRSQTATRFQPCSPS